MDTKERIMKTICSAMAITLDNNQLLILENTISTTLVAYDIFPSKDLPSTDTINTEKLLNMFLACKRIEGCKETTIKQYRYVITSFAYTVNLLDASTNEIRAYLGLKSNGNQNSYIDTIRRYLSSFYQWLVENDYVTKNPVKRINKIKCQKKIEEPFTNEQIVKMKDACKTPKEVILLDLLVSTGARRDEIRQIKISDIDFQSDTVKLHGKGGKERIVAFSATCKVHLASYISERPYKSEYLFCSDRIPHNILSKESLNDYIKKIGVRANIDNVHLHRFRHYFATYMAERGVDVRDLKEIMGHESIATTDKYYIWANTKKIQAVHRTFAS